MTSKKMGQSPLFNLIRDTEKDKKTEETKKQTAIHKDVKDHNKEQKAKTGETLKSEHEKKSVSSTEEMTVITASRQDRKKATYYIRKDLLKKFKMYSAEVERDMSDLVSEAIEGMISRK